MKVSETPFVRLSYYGLPGDWGRGVTFGRGRIRRLRRLFYGSHQLAWRIYWQGLGSWFFGWRRTSGRGVMVDIGPFAFRVGGQS